MKVKKGDNVKILCGKDRGKTSEIISVMPDQDRVIVKGINIVTKSRKPRGQEEKGGIIKVEAPIHVSNVQLIDPETKLASRIGYNIVKGEKTRVYKRKAKSSSSK